MGDRGTVYLGTARQRELVDAVTAAAADLRGQLQALKQLTQHRAYESADVETVRAAVFRAHGWQ